MVQSRNVKVSLGNVKLWHQHNGLLPTDAEVLYVDGLNKNNHGRDIGSLWQVSMLLGNSVAIVKVELS